MDKEKTTMQEVNVRVAVRVGILKEKTLDLSDCNKYNFAIKQNELEKNFLKQKKIISAGIIMLDI